MTLDLEGMPLPWALPSFSVLELAVSRVKVLRVCVIQSGAVGLAPGSFIRLRCCEASWSWREALPSLCRDGFIHSLMNSAINNAKSLHSHSQWICANSSHTSDSPMYV